MRLLLCDDQELLSETLAFLLGVRGHLVDHVAQPSRALDRLSSTDYDICVTELWFQEGSSIEFVRQARQLFPDLVLCVLTDSEDPGDVSRALRAGATAFLWKVQTADELMLTFESLVVGGAAVMATTALRPTMRASVTDPLDRLTPRERAVLEHLAGGAGTAEIAARLDVRVSTARTHVQNVLDKLGVHSRLEAVALAHQTAARRSDASGRRPSRESIA